MLGERTDLKASLVFLSHRLNLLVPDCPVNCWFWWMVYAHLKRMCFCCCWWSVLEMPIGIGSLTVLFGSPHSKSFFLSMFCPLLQEECWRLQPGCACFSLHSYQGRSYIVNSAVLHVRICDSLLDEVTQPPLLFQNTPLSQEIVIFPMSIWTDTNRATLVLLYSAVYIFTLVNHLFFVILFLVRLYFLACMCL